MTSRIMTFFDQIWARKNAFLAVFFVVYALSYGLFYAIDFVPEPVEQGAPAGAATTTSEAVVPVVHAETKEIAALPERIEIPALEKDVVVLNPKEASIAVLDEALLSGVVRHPESADFIKQGTMFLFGHSSYLPLVHNKNYQAFNGIQNLKRGEEVIVYSRDTAYVYRVTKVSKVAASDTSVTLQNDKERLILVTCNSFGSKDDRFMVEAELAEKRAL